ncbi:beta-glucosidase [termite gut metagenome]|uniref:beta-glucosidase n=1 Tax=termite gut metagenome TaxID=433724 RepID=A0A5J4SE03_9ZZZZ
MKQSLKFLFIGIFFVSLASCKNNKGNDPFYQKANDLLSKMTPEEKIGQLNQITGGGYADYVVAQIKANGIGSILNETDPNIINALQKTAVEETRLGIPILFARDVIHGFKTIFPVPLGQAASWNPQVVENGGRIAAVEASSVGIRWTFAPMLDIARDQRWGRVIEGFGEDPYLTSVLGVAMVKGLQGENLSVPTSIAACAKHFAGYGAAEGGLDYNTAIISTEQLRNAYLPPFKAAVDAGVGTLMVSFNEINGIPNSGNSYLIQQVLRKEWGFDGVVVSDWNSVGEMINHGYVKDPAEAAEKSLNSGIDMDMENHVYTSNLAQLVKEGKVKKTDIDKAVRRILQLKFQLGLFDNPYVALQDSIFYAENHLVKAKEAAIESTILLKNENDLLPLSDKIKSIAVIGPMADAPHDQLGSWVFDGEKSHTVTPLAALRKEYASQLKINYVAGLHFSRDLNKKQFAQAVSAAKLSDIVLFLAGEEAILSGEAHSRAEIALPGAQKELLAEIAKTGTPIVLIVMAGRVIEIYKELPLVDAYLFSFHPGTMGGPALTDLIFGKAVPSGKLPVTYLKMVGQTPIYYNHKNTGRPPSNELSTIENIPLEAEQVSLGNTSYYLDAGKDPLFPFGYGLSYTTFEYSNLQLSAMEIGKNDQLTASCIVKNTGTREGAEVVQLYIRDLVGSVTRPVKELKAFDKITLKPGEFQTVEFTLTTNALKFWNNEDREILEPGDFKLWIGPNSVEGLEGSFVLK